MTNLLEQPEHDVTDKLVVQARTDREAFGLLYDQMYAPLFRYCIRRTGNRSLAEDLTSTVFLNIANNIAGFPGTTYLDFRRWAFVIATNEIKANYRKSSRREELLAAAATDGRLGVSETEDTSQQQADDIDEVQAAIMRLPERDQTIITLRFFSELAYEDIGHILKLSPGAVRTAASRALEKVRDEVRREP